MSDNAPKVLLRSEETAGHAAVVELSGGGRPPLHRHDFDETFYVLEGELTFQLGDELFTRRAGELAFAPRGVAHTYANLSGASARALLVITPAGFERHFDQIAARVSGTEPPREAAKPIPEVVTLGPPLDETRRDEHHEQRPAGRLLELRLSMSSPVPVGHQVTTPERRERCRRIP